MFSIHKGQTDPAKYLNRSSYGRLLITAVSVPACPYGYWFLTVCCLPQFIFPRERCSYGHTLFPSSGSYQAVSSPHILPGDKESEAGRRMEETAGQTEWMRGARKWHCERMETDEDMTVTRRGKGKENMVRQSECWSESVTDRQRKRRAERKEGEGEGGRGSDVSWVKAPKLPWFLCERHSAEKMDSVCPLCQGMPKTMTSSPSNYQGQEARAPDSRLDLLFIIIHSLIHHFPCITLHHFALTPIMKSSYLKIFLKQRSALTSTYSQTLHWQNHGHE